MQSPFDDYQDRLIHFDAEGRLRVIPSDRMDLMRIDMSTNDYLALGAHWKDFLPEFQKIYPDASFSSSASRLLAGRQKHYEILEDMLGALYSKEALLFNSGYHANVGIIQALNIPDTVFLCDKLIHASMIDGLMLAKAEWQRWKHNDVDSLTKLLTKHRIAKRCIVVAESIYSMDGDLAPLSEIVALKKEFPNMILYVDEAHAFGVRGHRGLGLAEELGLIDDIDIIVGTLGKAAASSGAFVATNELLKQNFINTSRSLIFSTAIPPVNVAWSQLMITEILGMDRQRRHLSNISRRFREGMDKITGTQNPSDSQIVPLIVGDAKRAVHLAARLSSHGIEALPIRRPTVPVGGERIRFSLSADMTESCIDHVLKVLAEEYER